LEEARGHRLLVVLLLGPDLARLGPGARLVALFRLPTLVVWLSFGLRGLGVALGPGEAQEGFVALEAALPSRLDSP
jgi:hypothetical protein